ncbi:UDP-glycosyltransferase UGT5-like [Daphnia carinata]|uniref:UDP-glycosyltransferase UGT5-like n=1 Tax=Daphnia carinata TaxID=120202 RepID=UPI0025797B26|nr:UDP-glycosyltransferase UGT5-like [Daphnia carinata]
MSIGWASSLVLLSIIVSATPYKILVLTPITSTSHTNVFNPLVEALAERGHEVTHWNGLEIPSTSNSSNLRRLYSPNLVKINKEHNVNFNDRDSPLRLLFRVPKTVANYCKAIHEDAIFHQLMNAKDEGYDLILAEGFFNECTLLLAELFDVPFVYLNCFVPPPWLQFAIGTPFAFDHFPHSGLSFRDKMNFWQRTLNTVTGFLLVAFHHWYVVPIIDQASSRVLGVDKATSVLEIEDRHLSLLLTNTHFSINYLMPTSPAVVQVGGMHCIPPKPLSSDLESFVDGSGDDGFIIVSFGSILKGAEIPDNVRHIFMSTFARLSQRVVWKWEDKGILSDDAVPANVKLVSWLPQQDLLGHPKARLFITHCGLLSKQEAVFHGVPFIALPVWSDQPINSQKASDDGYAIRLYWNNLTEEVLYQSIERILTDPSYAEKMKQVSSIMRDQLESPVERAIYWIEYVIRHQGAPHLRSAARELSFYQRGLLDVILFFFVVASLTAYVFFRLSRFVLFSTSKRRWQKSNVNLKKQN